ncbi:hypothetical protein FDP41_011367 [Naegleria fowleri]|uniref:DUF4116 domain-containing protein n=1 Tax=Naegleria fowleri TaxID=5763 RepID=A0A6A5BYS3_NAEFO|nr:uncharacterized protein FDP41_011367 [Naegleria fowleri]KAF0982437.1 hypothetical protein FDP41_011367 [Naegleria fowleri]CAG4711751.1 unnamed protein product [Naegleria fowleri]
MNNYTDEAFALVTIILDSSCQAATLSLEFYINNPQYLKLRETRRREQKIYVHLLALKDFCKHYSIGSIHCFFSKHPFPFCDDTGAVLRAIFIHPGSIYYAHKQLKFDEEFVIKAVNVNFKVLEYAPKRFRNVPQLVELVEKARKMEKNNLVNQFRRLIEFHVNSPPIYNPPPTFSSETQVALNNAENSATSSSKRKSSSDPNSRSKDSCLISSVREVGQSNCC